MSFDALAPMYRGMEFVLAGRKLQGCRLAFLAECGACRRALLLGEGPGNFLTELLRVNPCVLVTCVEISPRMIAEARRRLSDDPRARVRFEQADALNWNAPPNQFDLIVTHFFLDCFRPEQLGALITKLASSARPDARWLLADFRTPETGWRRWRAAFVMALMYAFFRVVTGLSAARLTPPDKFIATQGFELKERRLANFGLLHSDLWERKAA
jgi:SAM-dependent methyltransferase